MNSEQFKLSLNAHIEASKKNHEVCLVELKVIEEIIKPAFKELNTSVELRDDVLYVHSKVPVEITYSVEYGQYKCDGKYFSNDAIVQHIAAKTSKSYVSPQNQ